MLRKIIQIDQEKCNGCGLCVMACHEGAIDMINGKAVLVRDDYCDGLGNCLPVCPTGAITFIEKNTLPFDEKAVENTKIEKLPCGCPGTQSKSLKKLPQINNKFIEKEITSELQQWPVQIKLVPANASYFDNANLLIAADCSAYAYANFHRQFIKNRVTLIGCPKLDEIEYSEKLTQIIKNNNIKSVTVVRMEVPCCGGIEHSTIEALKNSGKMIPWQVFTISVNGEIIE